MFETEERIRKLIITPDGEDEFQIRYISDENVGLLSTRSEKSYLILDSIDYWYDLIQNQYPTKRKCTCKNQFFKIFFDYVPRAGTDDYKAVKLISCCTECGKEREFATIDLKYSPTEHLFENPITYCEKPKIKYKKYSLFGYWEDNVCSELIDFLSQQQLLIYCWYWGLDKKRHFEKFTASELKKFLFEEKMRFLHVYFSREPLDEIVSKSFDDNGIYIGRESWRKKEIIDLNSIWVLREEGLAQHYMMDFCSEYLEADQVKAKSEEFCNLVRKVLEYGKKSLK